MACFGKTVIECADSCVPTHVRAAFKCLGHSQKTAGRLTPRPPQSLWNGLSFRPRLKCMRRRLTSHTVESALCTGVAGSVCGYGRSTAPSQLEVSSRRCATRSEGASPPQPPKPLYPGRSGRRLGWSRPPWPRPPQAFPARRAATGRRPDRLCRDPGRPRPVQAYLREKKRMRGKNRIASEPSGTRQRVGRDRLPCLRRAANRRGQRQFAGIVDGATETSEANQTCEIKPGNSTLIH